MIFWQYRINLINNDEPRFLWKPILVILKCVLMAVLWQLLKSEQSVPLWMLRIAIFFILKAGYMYSESWVADLSVAYCLMHLQLEDSCIQNCHLGRYIIGFVIRNFVLGRGICDHSIDNLLLQITVFNIVISILMHFFWLFSFKLVLFWTNSKRCQ